MFRLDYSYTSGIITVIVPVYYGHCDKKYFRSLWNWFSNGIRKLCRKINWEVQNHIWLVHFANNHINPGSNVIAQNYFLKSKFI
jgi:hypothetical protein